MSAIKHAIPTVVLVKGEQKIKVNEADAKDYKIDGWRLESKKETKSETDPETSLSNGKPLLENKPEKPEKPVKPTKSLDILPLPELRRIAKKIKIKGYTKLSKPDLVEVIKQAQAKTEK